VTTVRRLRGQRVITDPADLTARQVIDGQSSTLVQGAVKPI